MRSSCSARSVERADSASALVPVWDLESGFCSGWCDVPVAVVAFDVEGAEVLFRLLRRAGGGAGAVGVGDELDSTVLVAVAVAVADGVFAAVVRGVSLEVSSSAAASSVVLPPSGVPSKSSDKSSSASSSSSSSSNPNPSPPPDEDLISSSA